MGPQIRRAYLEDANTIAEFYVRVWRETYRAMGETGVRAV